MCAQQHFLQKEDGVEWNCPQVECTRHRAVLTHRISRLPATLVLHLKRFDHSLHRKLFTPIVLPETLDLSSVTRKEAPGSRVYKLRAIVLHLGETIHGGHFICHARGDDNRWRKFNDSLVSNLSPGDAYQTSTAQQNAYIICYEREANPSPKL